MTKTGTKVNGLVAMCRREGDDKQWQGRQIEQGQRKVGKRGRAQGECVVMVTTKGGAKHARWCQYAQLMNGKGLAKEGDVILAGIVAVYHQYPRRASAFCAQWHSLPYTIINDCYLLQIQVVLAQSTHAGRTCHLFYCAISTYFSYYIYGKPASMHWHAFNS